MQFRNGTVDDARSYRLALNDYIISGGVYLASDFSTHFRPVRKITKSHY